MNYKSYIGYAFIAQSLRSCGADYNDIVIIPTYTYSRNVYLCSYYFNCAALIFTYIDVRS